ncbi:WhiB family transcriptional regulator [Kitasatospora sp. NPDC048722]|uniref:WhiB family transcriptional regulator n=1 Tax=Kitasatospora sp. NPDC048722 TaxID=3155639 RepID=UPI0034035DFE
MRAAHRLGAQLSGTSYRAHLADRQAPCSETDPEVFFPELQSQRPLALLAGEEEPLAICGTCPLVDQVDCLRRALRVERWEQDGVSGGLTRAQRVYLQRDRSKDKDPDAVRRTDEALPAQIAAQLGVPPAHAEELLARVA